MSSPRPLDLDQPPPFKIEVNRNPWPAFSYVILMIEFQDGEDLVVKMSADQARLLAELMTYAKEELDGE